MELKDWFNEPLDLEIVELFKANIKLIESKLEDDENCTNTKN